MHPRQKARLRPELSPNFLSTLGPNPAQTRPEPEHYPKSPARLTTLEGAKLFQVKPLSEKKNFCAKKSWTIESFIQIKFFIIVAVLIHSV